MPEEQNVWGNEWNSRLNRFCTTVLRWRQLGDSNNDVWCERLRRKVGLDSVFGYQRNRLSSQQVILVEAKTIQRLDHISRSKIQSWCDDLLLKLEHAPLSPEFGDKYRPNIDAQFQVGVIALWVRDVATYDHSRLQEWLSKVKLPEKRVPTHIFIVANQTIGRLCAIHEETKRLSASYFFPSYGNNPPADGRSLPLEALVSRFLFGRETRYQKLVGSENRHPYEQGLTFYLGEVQTYPDLRFVGLALRDLQLLLVKQQTIYTLYDPGVLRNYVENLQREFEQYDATFELRRLNVNHELPSWLEEDL